MHSLRRGRFSVLAVGSLVFSGLGATTAVAAVPSTPSYVVDGASAWYEQAYENFDQGGYLTPKQADVTGPQRAPFGTGSHRMTIGESAAQTELYRTDAYDGVNLSNLTRLEYSTFARPTSGTTDRQATYLRLSVDNDGTDATKAIDASLFFYPANNGTVKNGTWQNWDVTGGLINVDGDSGAGEMSIADYAAAHPKAVLVNSRYDADHDAGSLSLITGGALGGADDPQTNGEYEVDRVIVGAKGTETLYDFGPNTETAGATSAHVVDPEHLAGWQHQAYDDVNYLDSDQTFVQGPGSPAAGVGSLRFSISTAENADRVELFRTTRYDGTLVRDLRAFDFSTYQKADAGNATAQQPVYARLSVDDNGDGTTDHTLFYYPGNNKAVEQSTWQDWSAVGGRWNVGDDAGPASGITLADYVVQHPDAKIVANGDVDAPAQPKGGVAFIAGGAGATQSNGQYFLDDVTIKTVDAATGAKVSGNSFDLEATAPVVSVGDAKVVEGNKGATLRFPVSLDHVAGYPVTVSFATADGSARAGKDYVAEVGQVTVPAGAKTVKVSVKVLSDLVREGDDTVTLTISGPSYGTLGRTAATGTIVNDDTRVALSLAQATRHRVKAHVDTLPVAPGDAVRVYRVTPKGRTLVLSTELNKLGRITTVLAKQYAAGTKVTFFATVRTDAGLYTSRPASITVRR